MDKVEWGLLEELPNGDSYELAGSEEVPSFMEYLRSEGSVCVRVDDVPAIQLAGICTVQLARTPLIYASCLRIPMSVFDIHPDRHLIVNVIHDPFLKIHDRELFVIDPEYKPHGMLREHIPDLSRETFDVRVSRAPYGRFKQYDMEYILSQHDIKAQLESKGWLSFNDQIEIIFWKEGEEALSTSPLYVSSILEYHYKRELSDELGVKICNAASGRPYGEAVLSAQKNALRKKARRNN